MGKDAVSAVTERGGIVVEARSRHPGRLHPRASTRPTGIKRIALCLPEQDCAMNRRGVLTEIGTDAQALRKRRSRRASCSISASARCRRTFACASTIEEGRGEPAPTCRPAGFRGRQSRDGHHPAGQSAPRLCSWKLGRIEVYQPIPPPSGKSPDGPHTHVLPKLLKSGRTHPATEPFLRGNGFPARIFTP